jgi:hypothetical protein
MPCYENLRSSKHSCQRMSNSSSPMIWLRPGEPGAMPPTVDLELSVPQGDVPLYARLQDVLDTGERKALADELQARPGL